MRGEEIGHSSIGNKVTRTKRTIADSASLEMKLRAIAIPERLPGDDFDIFRLNFNLAGTPQRLNQNFAPELGLRLLLDVLVVATSAAPEDRTPRLNPRSRSLLQLNEPRPLHLLPRTVCRGFDHFSGEHQRRQYYFAVDAAEAIAAVH